jgi:metal-sulfur cluster biosynthetic enzyme
VTQTGVVAAAEVADLLAALAGVRDPELDEPVTALGFVSSACVDADGMAEVRLRLPTYFCAPNFAYLMVADAYDAVSAVPGVSGARVLIEDHFAADAINAGVAARAGFRRSFEGEAAAELDQLRIDFIRKAVLAGTDRVCRPMLAAGRDLEDLATLTLGDAPPSPDRERLRSRRAELGLAASDDSALIIDAITGRPVPADALKLHLGRARLTRVSAEANSGVCRGMLRSRYRTAGIGQMEEL